MLSTAVFVSSVSAAPWQHELDKEKIRGDFVAYKKGKPVARTTYTEDGKVNYRYDDDGQLIEVVLPDKKTIKYIYINRKLEKVILPDNSASYAVYKDDYLIGLREASGKVRPIWQKYKSKDKKVQGSTSATEDPIFNTMDIACQIDPDTGENYNCYNWPGDGGGESGGGGGGGGGDVYIPDPGSAGGTPGGGQVGGGGEASDTGPVYPKTPAQLLCEASVYRAYLIMKDACMRFADKVKRESCHADNAIWLAEENLKCARE